ncbi:hypothetical protein PTTG_29767 [Puccinia triticina 1-1 BBBD Race 1]|uniref:Uncharacterized protein n=1 Tax=Puccinia triticina (isolate 1-1 / race 1 (BBBD)) TaxID=630390 RepID=A0A180G211_PUCT1|nr:hypothetical protein PTTG_29767 [Puccinia triticina 1-1 BBBD Race 1]
MADQTSQTQPQPQGQSQSQGQGERGTTEQAREQARIQNAQKLAAKNALNRGGLVLGANQAHAFAMSSTLNKVKGIDDLTDSNYTTWSNQLGGALNLIFLANYILDANF